MFFDIPNGEGVLLANQVKELSAITFGLKFRVRRNNKNGHNKTLQLDQHQIDQGSIASMSMTSVHSPDSHEYSCSYCTEFDNLQLDNTY